VFGSYRLFQPVSTVASYDSYLAKTVSSDSGIPGALYPTGGTYTLTFAGSTTAAIAFGASAGTVQTALNLLTPISNRGNVVVTGSYNSAAGLTITFNSYATLTIDTSLITTDTGTFYSSLYANTTGYQQSVNVQPNSSGGNINGGTFTLTIFGQTTAAIAWNATAATVAAALNALSEVQTKRGGVTVQTQLIPGSSSYQPTIAAQLGGTFQIYISFSLAFGNAVMTASATSLTPAGSAVTPALTTGTFGAVQTVVFSAGVSASRQLGVVAHGLNTTDTLYIKADGSYVAYSGTFTTPSSDIVLLVPTAGTTAATATAITEIGKRTVASYTPGSALTRINRVTQFYLPGVSVGITTAADIPLPVYEGDSTALLTAIFAQETAINYQVGELEQWRGPVLQRTITTINATQL
jgi:hypothetical protein